MARHIAANALTLVIVGLIVAFGLINWGRTQYTGPGPAAQEVFVEIPAGATWTRASALLEDAGAISSARIFRIGRRYSRPEEQLKLGFYAIPPGASMDEIAALLAEGGATGTRYRATIVLRADGVTPRLVDQTNAGIYADMPPEEVTQTVRDLVDASASLELRVAVPEGLTSWQVVQGLNGIEFLSGEIADIPAEGSLAPDTYAFRAGQDRSEILALMQRAQERIVAEAWEGRAPGLPLNTPEELLILASVIEKETGVPEERRQVASVFVNRLERGMRLQTDPTVIYGVTGGREVLGRGLRQSELDRDTPYNTYQRAGLPPTPIANPGRLAIEAAANPDTTPYIFFVADGSGGHAFAETLAEHDRNVVRWRQIEAERNANQ